MLLFKLLHRFSNEAACCVSNGVWSVEKQTSEKSIGAEFTVTQKMCENSGKNLREPEPEHVSTVQASIRTKYDVNSPVVLSQMKPRIPSIMCAKCATSMLQRVLRNDVRGHCSFQCGLARHGSDAGLRNVPNTCMAPWAAGCAARVVARFSAHRGRTLWAPMKGSGDAKPPPTVPQSQSWLL